MGPVRDLGSVDDHSIRPATALQADLVAAPPGKVVATALHRGDVHHPGVRVVVARCDLGPLVLPFLVRFGQAVILVTTELSMSPRENREDQPVVGDGASRA